MAKTLVYQLYPIAWEGGLKAMTKHISIINQLDADYIWLSPLYPSPRFDHGYDVADYTSIDSRFGTMADFDEFVRVAHSFGIGVIMDLVLNHTSTEHNWFKEYPGYYCRTDLDFLSNYQNLFDSSNKVWEFDPIKGPFVWSDDNPNIPGDYYLHLFHKKQADLDWFPWHNDYQRRYKINKALVREFKAITNFWTEKHNVDGFRLDAIQALNKDLCKIDMQLSDLIFGSRASEVINAIFSMDDAPFLILECIDPTYGGLTEFYYSNTQANFIINTSIKDVIETEERQEFKKIVDAASQDPGFMLDLESHDSPRFPSRGVKPKDAIDLLFGSDPEGICLYQGQELGLYNPTKVDLPDEKMLSLDAETSMRVARGEDIDVLRPHSRANARIPLPLDEYDKQIKDPNSVFNYTKDWIDRWKQ